MKAPVYHSPDQKSWEEKPKPTIIQGNRMKIKITKFPYI